MTEKVAAAVLSEAKGLVSGDRHEAYGAAEQHFTDIAEGMSLYLRRRGLLKDSLTLDARDVAILQVIVKVCREANQHSRDNCVDGAGYLALAEEVYRKE